LRPLCFVFCFQKAAKKDTDPQVITETTEIMQAEEFIKASPIGSAQLQADSYFGGFVARYVNKVLKCSDCLTMICTEEIQQSHIYTNFKEFDDQRRLIYAEEQFSLYCGSVVRVVLKNVRPVAHRENLDVLLFQSVGAEIKYRPEGCIEHRGVFGARVLKFLVNTSLHWFSKIFNAELKEAKDKAARKAARVARVVKAHQKLVKQSLAAARRRQARNVRLVGK
jgi:hypothetical protein